MYIVGAVEIVLVSVNSACVNIEECVDIRLLFIRTHQVKYAKVAWNIAYRNFAYRIAILYKWKRHKQNK